MKRKPVINESELLDILGTEGEIIASLDKGCTAKIKWSDGEITFMYFKNGWHFPDDNASYRSSYSYVCGYRD